MKNFGIFCFCFLFINQVNASDWLMIEANEVFDMSIDKANILRKMINNQALIGGWTKVLYKNGHTNTTLFPNRPVEAVQVLTWHDCKRNLATPPVEYRIFDKNSQETYSQKNTLAFSQLKAIGNNRITATSHNQLCLQALIQDEKNMPDSFEKIPHLKQEYPYQFQMINRLARYKSLIQK